MDSNTRIIRSRAWDGIGNHGMVYYGSLEELIEYCRPHKFQKFMLATGLKDSKGEKVFDGDIIRHPGTEGLEDRGVVFYSDDFAMFKVRSCVIQPNCSDEYDLWDCINMSGEEVIGNIYNDPHLLV